MLVITLKPFPNFFTRCIAFLTQSNRLRTNSKLSLGVTTNVWCEYSVASWRPTIITFFLAIILNLSLPFLLSCRFISYSYFMKFTFPVLSPHSPFISSSFFSSLFCFSSFLAASCLHFVLLFWNQTFTCVSDKPNMAPIWSRSRLVTYLVAWKRFSRPRRCSCVKTGRHQGRVEVRMGGE